MQFPIQLTCDHMCGQLQAATKVGYLENGRQRVGGATLLAASHNISVADTVKMYRDGIVTNVHRGFYAQLKRLVSS